MPQKGHAPLAFADNLPPETNRFHNGEARRGVVVQSRLCRVPVCISRLPFLSP